MLFFQIVTELAVPAQMADGLIRCGKRGSNHWKHWSDYRPSNAERTARKRKQFDAIAREIKLQGLTPELRTQLDAVRPQKCTACRVCQKKSDVNDATLKGQTRAYWYEIRQEPCVDCGRDDGFSEFDHIDPSQKTWNLGDHAYWAVRGGVEAMKREKALCEARCRNCHMRRENMPIYQARYARWQDMPETTTAGYKAKWDRRQVQEKEAYINDIKRRLGECADCAMAVDDSAFHIFVFAHTDASEKRCNVADLRKSRQSFATAKPLIDAEVARCRLLCQVCHSKETRARNGNLSVEEVFG